MTPGMTPGMTRPSVELVVVVARDVVVVVAGDGLWWHLPDQRVGCGAQVFAKDGWGNRGVEAASTPWGGGKWNYWRWWLVLVVL